MLKGLETDLLLITVKPLYNVQSVAMGNSRPWCHYFYSAGAMTKERSYNVTIRKQSKFKTYITWSIPRLWHHGLWFPMATDRTSCDHNVTMTRSGWEPKETAGCTTRLSARRFCHGCCYGVNYTSRGAVQLNAFVFLVAMLLLVNDHLLWFICRYPCQ